MAQEAHWFDGSQWREATKHWVFDGSQWRVVKELHVFDGSQWREFWVAPTEISIISATGAIIDGSSWNLTWSLSSAATTGYKLHVLETSSQLELTWFDDPAQNDTQPIFGNSSVSWDIVLTDPFDVEVDRETVTPV